MSFNYSQREMGKETGDVTHTGTQWDINGNQSWFLVKLKIAEDKNEICFGGSY